MRFLTRFSLRNPVAIAILALIIAVGGVFSARSLKEELMPDIAYPVIAVVTTYPGASPQEVATNVTKPLETALQGVSGVQDITSTSVENVSEIEISLNMDANLTTATQQAQDELNQVQLPSGAGTPSLQKFSFDSAPVVYFTVTAKNGDTQQLRSVVNNTIIPAMKGVSGVASLETGGAQQDVVSMKFDPSKLKKYNLTMQQVIQDLQADTVTMPLGSATVNNKINPVQLNTHFSSLKDIQNLKLPVPPNANAATQQIGTALGQLGLAVQGMGQGMQQLGQGEQQLGQGVGALQAENQLLSALQSVQGQLFGAQLALTQEMSKPASQQNPSQIAQLQAEIKALQSSQQNLSQQLSKLQKSMSAASGAGQGNKSSLPATPAKTSSSSAGGAASSTPSKLQTIPLKDVATVTLTQPTGGSINRTNGHPSVFIGTVKTEDANTVQMANAVNSEIASLQSQLPKNIQIVPLFDTSTMIKASINGMMREAILGAIFAVLVIMLFLRNWLTTLIAVASIPLSLLTAVILLNRFNVSMNIMTLGGMAVATGRVVDDSIVVIENIYRTWRRGLGLGKGLVRFATGEVSSAITSSTITTVAVFLPLGLVQGVVGKIFFPFALTVVCSLLSSLLVALTVVPLLAWLLVTRRKAKGVNYDGVFELESDEDWQAAGRNDRTQGDKPVFQPWQVHYQRALNWCLNHKSVVLLVTAVAFVASIAVLPIAGSTFIPSSQEKFATISITMPTGTPQSDTVKKASQVEKIVLAHQSAIDQLNTDIGGDSGQTSAMGGTSGSNSANMFLSLKSNANVDTLVSTLRQQLKPIAGPADIQVNEMTMGGATGNFSMIVTGSDETAVKQAATEITTALHGVSGLANIDNNLAATRPEISVEPKTQQAAEYGLTPYQIGTAVSNYVSRNNVGTIDLDGQTYNIQAYLKSSSSLTKLTSIRNLPLATQLGSSVKLSDVATVKVVNAPVSILHRNGAAYADVTATFTGKNTGKTTTLATQKIAQLKLPSGVQTQLSGDSQEQNQSFADLIDAILIAIGLVYIVMLITFGEWAAPLAILFSMPVALIGAFFGTVIGHQPVSVSSLIGMLMLTGIVVTNAIVLVDRVERQRRGGLTIREALLEAGTTRLRPILMTAIATIFALAPLAAGFAEGALISQGLAVVVIGGLITSTVLTLVIVPVMYELLHFRQHRRQRREAMNRDVTATM